MGITSSSSVQPEDLASLQNQEKLTQLRNQIGSGEDKEKKLKDAAQGFESIFMGKLWEKMRATVPKDDYLHSKEEDMYLSMFDRELSQKMAAAGGIGLGQMLYDNLKESLNEASQEAMPLNPLNGSATATLNPLPARTSVADRQSEGAESISEDVGTMQELEQLIQKIESEHDQDRPGSRLTKNV